MSKTLGVSVRVEAFSVYVNGRRIKAVSSAKRTLQLVSNIASANVPADPYWMVKHRLMIREIISCDRNECGTIGVRKTLIAIIKGTYRDEVRRLAIWLRGHCSGGFGRNEIEKHLEHPDWRMRKEVTRTLSRLAAWDTLRSIEENDPNPRVRRLAMQQSSRQFCSRLAKFSESVQPRKLSTSEPKQPLYVHESVKLKTVYYPKSLGLIRYYLKQIRNTVHGLVFK